MPHFLQYCTVVYRLREMKEREERISWQAGEVIRRGLLGDVFCCLDEQCGRIMAVEKVGRASRFLVIGLLKVLVFPVTTDALRIAVPQTLHSSSPAARR